MTTAASVRRTADWADYNLGGQRDTVWVQYDSTHYRTTFNLAGDGSSGPCYAELVLADIDRREYHELAIINRGSQRRPGRSEGQDWFFYPFTWPELAPDTDYRFDFRVATSDVHNFGCPTNYNAGPLVARAKAGAFVTSGEDTPSVPTIGSLNVYPNPSGGTLHVEWTSIRPSTVDLVVFDALSRRVAEQSGVVVPAGPSRLPLTLDVPSGPYLLRLTDAAGTVQTQRITVVR